MTPTQLKNTVKLLHLLKKAKKDGINYDQRCLYQDDLSNTPPSTYKELVTGGRRCCLMGLFASTKWAKKMGAELDCYGFLKYGKYDSMSAMADIFGLRLDSILCGLPHNHDATDIDYAYDYIINKLHIECA